MPSPLILDLMIDPRHAGFDAQIRNAVRQFAALNRAVTRVTVRACIDSDNVPVEIPREGTLYLAVFMDEDKAKVQLSERLFLRIHAGVLHEHHIPV